MYGLGLTRSTAQVTNGITLVIKVRHKPGRTDTEDG